MSRRADLDAEDFSAEAYRRDEERKQEHIRQIQIIARQKVKRERANYLMSKSGLKRRFQSRTFPNFICDTAEKKRCWEVAKEYADNFERYAKEGIGLYIEGPNGTGKTHLAAAITLQLIKEGIPVVFKTSGDMLADIKDSFRSSETNEGQVMQIYKDVDLLVIDDLGKEQCSDWSVSTLYSILNERYEDMKPTIITTNYNTNNLARALTPRGSDPLKITAIISRLKEVSKVVTMAWQDVREVGI